MSAEIDGPGGSKGNGVASGSSRHPLVGFFGIFLAETRKIPAGGISHALSIVAVKFSCYTI